MKSEAWWLRDDRGKRRRRRRIKVHVGVIYWCPVLPVCWTWRTESQVSTARQALTPSWDPPFKKEHDIPRQQGLRCSAHPDPSGRQHVLRGPLRLQTLEQHSLPDTHPRTVSVSMNDRRKKTLHQKRRKITKTCLSGRDQLDSTIRTLFSLCYYWYAPESEEDYATCDARDSEMNMVRRGRDREDKAWVAGATVCVCV